MRASTFILILVAIIFPPAAAGFITGCSCDLLINICLTILGYIPGHIHAFWLIYRKAKAEERYGQGGYTYIGNGEFQAAPVKNGGVLPPGQAPPNYGAAGGY